MTPYVAVENDGMLFFLPTADKGGVGRFAKLDWKETRSLRRALDVLGRLGLRLPGSTFVDVGAHIGTTSIAAVRRFGFAEALAFEPEPENFRLLRANLAANDADEAVHEFNVAVSRRRGTAQLRLRPGAGTRHSLTRSGQEEAGTVPVPTTDLDSMADRGELDPDAVGLLWLDVESHELEVLQGAHSLVSRGVPIVMELNAREVGGKRLDALQALLARSYTGAVDLRTDPAEGTEVIALGDIGRAAERHPRGFTDLLVFREAA